MTQNSSKGFFFSYHQADRAWAEWITRQLEAEGFNTNVEHGRFSFGEEILTEEREEEADVYMIVYIQA